MDFLSSAILSGIIYDRFVEGCKISSKFLKQKLQGWIFDDEVIVKLSDKLTELHLEELGEHTIKKKIDDSHEILQFLQQIKPNQIIYTTAQNHSGSGDNIAGNKIINNG